MITADSARRRYVAISFLTWLPVGLYLAPMVLLMLERGLSLGEVATIGAVYSVAIVVLELPTGGLSDVLGRRPVLLASAATGLGGLLLLGLGGSLWPLAASAMLRGVARALSSGPAEAWYVDAVHAAAGRDADLAPAWPGAGWPPPPRWPSACSRAARSRSCGPPVPAARPADHRPWPGTDRRSLDLRPWPGTDPRSPDQRA
ncbi:MFS transporter [Catellatospora bangladeshensis]|uniref:MFS transporter n=1 Tax=Catellatospora bangladeshensis TaxID=310355 RepID=UPI00360B43DB